MNPGATYFPDASIAIADSARPTRPTRAIFPLRIPTSARRDAEPVPSTTCPPRMTTSKGIAWRTPGVSLTALARPLQGHAKLNQPCLRLTVRGMVDSVRWSRLSRTAAANSIRVRETVYTMRAFERRLIDIMQSWEEELQAFRRRTKKSAQAWEAAKKRIPFGVNSNYRLVDPYPLYVRKAQGSRIWDADGMEYIDFCMAFGALVAGHSHPVLAKAMRERVSNGTIFGFESVDAGPLAEHICRRFRLDRLKFSMTGLDATLFAVRLARAVTGRRRILKFEGCYHGSHDALMVSIKPKKEVEGDRRRPNPVLASKGLLKELIDTAVVAPFNDLDATETLALAHADDLAGIILEPVPMNMGYVQPEPGFLAGMRAVADEVGAGLILYAVKTCGKWYGGAEEAFGVTPDVKVLGKSIAGGFPLAAVGGTASIMDQIVPGQIGHAGTFNANPVSISAGLVTMTKILTRAGMRHAQQMGDDLAKGYRDIVRDHGLSMVVQSGGISGTVHFARGPVTDWRSFQDVDVGRWWGYYTAMLNRGVIPMATGPDEQWTTSVAHTQADVTRHLEAFEDVAEGLKQSRAEMAIVES